MWGHWGVVLLSVAVVGAVAVSAADRPIVPTEYGPVRCTTDDKGQVQLCHGIPFAAPPLDDLRWKPTQPHTNWTEPRDASRKGPGCPQLDAVRLEHIGNEDCLWLSVYTPKQCTAAAPCPVMQWIYGGAWILGSNDEFGLYDGTDLAAEYGVVIVAANYRLDTLGWMALDELAAESPTGSYGNYGLIDQGFALEWSQRNIRAFGGDPNKVTIFGESAGGYSVCQHITRPESNGLFSSAIMESGGCDGPWLIFDGEDSKAWGDYYAEKVGCPATASGADRLTCLRKKSVDAILEPYASWFCPVKRPDDPWCNRTSGAPIDAMRDGGADGAGGVGSWPSPRPPMAPIVGWATTVDGTALGLPETPYQAMLKGKINKSPTGENISVIFGTNANEMALFIAASFLVFPGVHIPVAKDDIRLAAEHLLAYHRPSWNESDVDRVLAAYNTGDLAGAHPAYILTAMGTDFSFACNTHRAAAALQAAGVNAYVYLFDFKFPGYIDPKSELCQLGSEVGCGVAHGCEVEYVFQHSNLGANEKAVSSSMGAWWTNMAKYGNPNGQGAEVWTTYSAGTPSIMHINEKPAVSTTPATDSRCEVWNALPTA